MENENFIKNANRLFRLRHIYDAQKLASLINSHQPKREERITTADDIDGFFRVCRSISEKSVIAKEQQTLLSRVIKSFIDKSRVALSSMFINMQRIKPVDLILLQLTYSTITDFAKFLG